MVTASGAATVSHSDLNPVETSFYNWPGSCFNMCVHNIYNVNLYTEILIDKNAPGGCCNTIQDGRSKRILYLNLTKSRSHNLLSRCQIVMKSCTECISITAMFCVKFRNDSITDMDDMEEWDGARFQFDPSFGRSFLLQQSQIFVNASILIVRVY